MTQVSGWLAIGKAVESNVLVEPLDPGYARQPVTETLSDTGQMTLSAGITFGPFAATFGPVSDFALFDAVSGGTMLGYATISPAIAVQADQLLTIPAGPYAIATGSPLPAVLTASTAALTSLGHPLTVTA